MQVVVIYNLELNLSTFGNDKLYIFSSVAFYAGAYFNLAWTSASTFFSAESFLSMPCKTVSDSEEK